MRGRRAFTGELPGEFLYFYHPDNLGSTSYVTDDKGAIYEHLQYFPFGETWVQEGQPSNRIPYLFSSKELDQETGLYYFGARYYDPRTSVWISTEPALPEFLPFEGPNDDSLDAIRTSNNILGARNSLPENDPIFTRSLGAAPKIKNQKDGNTESATLEISEPVREKSRIYDSFTLATYTYVKNNPLRLTDPDGRDVKFRSGTSTKMIENIEKAKDPRVGSEETKKILERKREETSVTIPGIVKGTLVIDVTLESTISIPGEERSEFEGDDPPDPEGVFVKFELKF